MNLAGWIVVCSVLSSIAVCFVVAISWTIKTIREIKKINEEAPTNE